MIVLVGDFLAWDPRGYRVVQLDAPDNHVPIGKLFWVPEGSLAGFLWLRF